MIVDKRAGSVDLYPQLQMAGVRPLELGTLGYGDVQIEGRGPEGCPVLVGVEYKKLGDICQSIDNGRLVGHQLPGMLECYQDVWVLIEGIYRIGRSGDILVQHGASWRSLRSGNGTFMALALSSFLLTLQIKLGVKVWHTGTSTQTVQWLSALNHWWTGKDYEDHRAHLAFDSSQALSLISRPNLTRRMAKELEGIGWERSSEVAKKFRTPFEMCLAETEDWVEIPGIGKVTAQKAVKALRGDNG